jgi:CRP-like cAMP-binding protein
MASRLFGAIAAGMNDMATPLQRLSRPHRNKLLAQLDSADMDKLEPSLQPVSLDFRQQLYDWRQRITHVYFPLSGVVAVMRSLSDGNIAQVASVGNEGVVGYGAMIDAPVASGRAVVQLAGEAVRIETAAIQAFALEHPRFRAMAMHYGHVLISHLIQSVVCHQFHSARQRYALWLLQTHDRAQRDTFRLTQEMVAQTLGVRRATVSDIARDIQKSGAVHYGRGVLTVRNRAALMSQACECYASMQEEYDRLLHLRQPRP